MVALTAQKTPQLLTPAADQNQRRRPSCSPAFISRLIERKEQLREEMRVLHAWMDSINAVDEEWDRQARARAAVYVQQRRANENSPDASAQQTKGQLATNMRQRNSS